MSEQLFKWVPPPCIPTDAWEAFVAMRKKKGSRAPWSDVARDRAIAKLVDMHRRGIDINEVLLTCVEFGWSGVEWGENELARRPTAQHSHRGDAPLSRQAQGLANLERMKR